MAAPPSRPRRALGRLNSACPKVKQARPERGLFVFGGHARPLGRSTSATSLAPSTTHQHQEGQGTRLCEVARPIAATSATAVAVAAVDVIVVVVVGPSVDDGPAVDVVSAGVDVFERPGIRSVAPGVDDARVWCRRGCVAQAGLATIASTTVGAGGAHRGVNDVDDGVYAGVNGALTAGLLVLGREGPAADAGEQGFSLPCDERGTA